MADDFSDLDLRAYLDESLAIDATTRLETALRDDEPLRRRLADLMTMADAGEHSIGAVWRRRRLTCADRSTLGAYLLNVLPDEERRYLDLHLNVIGCRFCAANLDEMRDKSAEAPAAGDDRRRRFFESSVGRLCDGE